MAKTVWSCKVYKHFYVPISQKTSGLFAVFWQLHKIFQTYHIYTLFQNLDQFRDEMEEKLNNYQ